MKESAEEIRLLWAALPWRVNTDVTIDCSHLPNVRLLEIRSWALGFVTTLSFFPDVCKRSAVDDSGKIVPVYKIWAV